MSRLIPFVVVVFAAAGCPRPIDNADAGPDGGTADVEFCSDVSECSGFDPNASTQQVRCDGICRTICNGVDEVCPAGFFCDNTGTCAEGCRDSGECGDGKLCVDGTCTEGSSECSSKCDCDPGEICELPAGQCVAAGASCDNGDQCPRGPLTPTDDCEAFQCNGFSHQCFDPSPTPCTQAAECIGRPGCTGGAVCTCTSSGACVPDADCTPQTEQQACGSGNFCDGNGDCQALPVCTGDGDCTAFGLTCNEGSARCERPQACVDSTTCTAAPATFCDDGFCAIPNCLNGGTTCQANQDCSADGRCVAQGTGAACVGNQDCPADQFCNFALNPDQCSTGCRDNGSCGINQTCNGSHQCVNDGGGGGGQFGDACIDDSECQSPMLCGVFTGTCAEVCVVPEDCIACNARNGACTCNGLGFCQP